MPVEEIARDYIADESTDLIEGEVDFLPGELVCGRIFAYAAMGGPPLPALVAADDERRLPIPPIGNARAGAIIADAARCVLGMWGAISVRIDPGPCGMILDDGAGTVIDAIQGAALKSEEGDVCGNVNIHLAPPFAPVVGVFSLEETSDSAGTPKAWERIGNQRGGTLCRPRST